MTPEERAVSRAADEADARTARERNGRPGAWMQHFLAAAAEEDWKLANTTAEDLRIANVRRYCQAMRHSVSVERQEMAFDILAILNGDITGEEDPLRCEKINTHPGHLWGQRCRKRGAVGVVAVGEMDDDTPTLHPFCDVHAFVEINEMWATSDDTVALIRFEVTS